LFPFPSSLTNTFKHTFCVLFHGRKITMNGIFYHFSPKYKKITTNIIIITHTIFLNISLVGVNTIKGVIGYKVKVLSKDCIWHMAFLCWSIFLIYAFFIPNLHYVLNIITFYYILVRIIYIIVMTFLVRECYGSPKISIKFVKIRQNSLKFTPEECYDKVLNEEF
jgi:hypothetical protein